MINYQKKLKNLPQSPGVYFFRDSRKKILYIGKATNLKSRVSSYFRGTPGSRPIESMIHKVVDIETQETDSVLEALILESNLIKKFQPKYNVDLKDDKSFSYAVITKEKFPRVLVVRETDLKKSVIPSLSRNLIRSSRRFAPQDDKNIKNTFGPYTSKKQLEIALKIMRKIFPYHSNKAETEKGCLNFQIGLCPGPYAGTISSKDYAKNIRGIQMILEGRKQSLLRKLEKEMAAFSGKKEFEKAAESRNKIFALKHIQDVALISQDFEREANLKTTNQKIQNMRIEAYDISNISGQYAVGSMVVFINGQPDKNEYRKFKIKTVDGSNDVGMMAEVLFRRFGHSEWTKPDLILLDGGVGHLNMAEKVLQELNLKIPLAAAAKGPTRKKLDLRFSMDDLRIKIEENLIKRIMDEAHRFAISYHRKLRKKSFI
jgi:excinuclease ABC subunit C